MYKIKQNIVFKKPHTFTIQCNTIIRLKSQLNISIKKKSLNEDKILITFSRNTNFTKLDNDTCTHNLIHSTTRQ